MGYTHHRERQLSIRGMRFAVLLCILPMAYELVTRHVEFINLGWW